MTKQRKPLKVNDHYFLIVNKETGEPVGPCGENILYDSLFEISPQDVEDGEEVRKVVITEWEGE